MSSTSSACTSTTTKRSIVIDSNGAHWDLASPGVIGIISVSGGTQTQLVFPENGGGGAVGIVIPLAFSSVAAIFDIL